MTINFNTTKPVAEQKEDFRMIAKIAQRGRAMAVEQGFAADDQMSAVMDVAACHANGCPLRLQELLDADDFNFAHDFFGIRRHLDRTTGELTNFFRPRFAAPKAEREEA